MSDSAREREGVVVLITSHNRCAQTLACLRSLRVAAMEVPVPVSLVLVDAGSGDGTADTVEALWPDAKVRRVAEDVYWGGGMRHASHVAGHESAWKLWLNDDVCLSPGSLALLLSTADAYRRQHHREPVVVGATVDAEGATSYSGLRQGRHPLSFTQVVPHGSTQQVDTFNGNVVLWPTRVLDLLGDIDPHFPHAMGDVDLGLRARAAGHELLLAPTSVGRCQGNRIAPEIAATAGQRLRAVTTVKALPPAAWVRFSLRHGGWLGPLYAVRPYVRALMARGARGGP